MKDAADVAAVKKECEDALGLAMPILEAALEALDTLTVADIAQVKAMTSPPKGVRIVMEAVCVMLSIPPDRVKDPEGGLLMIKDYWPASKRLLGDPKFLGNNLSLSLYLSYSLTHTHTLSLTHSLTLSFSLFQVITLNYYCFYYLII